MPAVSSYRLPSPLAWDECDLCWGSGVFSHRERLTEEDVANGIWWRMCLTWCIKCKGTGKYVEPRKHSQDDAFGHEFVGDKFDDGVCSCGLRARDFMKRQMAEPTGLERFVKAIGIGIALTGLAVVVRIFARKRWPM